VSCNGLLRLVPNIANRIMLLQGNSGEDCQVRFLSSATMAKRLTVLVFPFDRAKNQRALNAKLRGSTLGDAAAEEDAESTASWIKKNKKMQKQRAREIQMARQRELEQEERDRGVYDEGQCFLQTLLGKIAQLILPLLDLL
jgi:hypothetical protein